MMRLRNLRRGFTLIELLVVIAIMAILVSLLLPAAQSAREAARRAQCMNNQRQVALAIVAYESAHRRLPASGQVLKNDEANYGKSSFNPRSGRQISWAVMILPHLEEQGLYDRFDITRSIFDQPKLPQQEHVATYTCPSDSAGDRFFQHEELTENVRFAKGNYVAYVSPFHIDAQVWYPGALGGGRWVGRGTQDSDVHQGQRLNRVTDGLSKTIAVSEVRTRANSLDQRGAWALPWAGAGLLALDVHPVLRRIRLRPEMKIHYIPNLAAASIAQLPNSADAVDILYDCQKPGEAELRGMPCATWGAPGSRASVGYLSAAPRSQHAGGVVTAALDGHVRFVADDVDPGLMSYMVSVNDGQSSKLD